jgi:hypothetical protein
MLRSADETDLRRNAATASAPNATIRTRCVGSIRDSGHSIGFNLRGERESCRAHERDTAPQQLPHRGNGALMVRASFDGVHRFMEDSEKQPRG